MKTITVEMTTEQFNAISKLVNYIVDTETESFEEHVAEGYDPKTHVMNDANIVAEMLEKN